MSSFPGTIPMQSQKVPPRSINQDHDLSENFGDSRKDYIKNAGCYLYRYGALSDRFL